MWLKTTCEKLMQFIFLEIASDGLKGRVFEVSLADLQNDEVAFRKFKLITEDVQGKNCLTNFHGMDLTRDKMCSMVKKWQVSRTCIIQFNCHIFGLELFMGLCPENTFSCNPLQTSRSSKNLLLESRDLLEQGIKCTAASERQ